MCNIRLAFFIVAPLWMRAPFALAQQPPPHPLLGYGRGVDHIGIGVRDLIKSRHDYEELGFRFREGGRFPGGVSNTIIPFENKTYLELLTVTPAPGDPAAHDLAAEEADFIRKHEGAMFLGLNVSSANATASYLKTQNFDVEDPQPGSRMKEGETKPPPAQWYILGIADKPAPDKLGISLPVFFIEYLAADRDDKWHKEGVTQHPNTALGVHAVWFAVRDVKSQLQRLRAAGLETDGSRDVDLLSAHGREVKAASGTMILLAPNEKSSVLQEYLSEYDEGIFAVSVEVSDLAKAQRIAESAGAGKVKTYKGAYGRSLLLPPHLTHGIWVEMFQR